MGCNNFQPFKKSSNYLFFFFWRVFCKPSKPSLFCFIFTGKTENTQLTRFFINRHEYHSLFSACIIGELFDILPISFFAFSIIPYKSHFRPQLLQKYLSDFSSFSQPTHTLTHTHSLTPPLAALPTGLLALSSLSSPLTPLRSGIFLLSRWLRCAALGPM